MIKIGPAPVGTAPVPLAPRERRDEDVSLLIPASAGGTLSRADRTSITISTGALLEDLEVSISTPAVRWQQEEDLKQRKLDDGGFVAVSTGAVFGPEGTVFQRFVTIVLPYDPAAVKALGLSDLGLQASLWDPDRQQWRWLPTTVDMVHHTVTARTGRLSLIKVVGKKPQQ